MTRRPDLKPASAASAVGRGAEPSPLPSAQQAGRKETVQSRYRNPWYDALRNNADPPEYVTEAAPTRYRGYLIYRRLPACFDVVGARCCIGQYAGLPGAKGLVDLICDSPGDFWAQRALSCLAAEGADAPPSMESDPRSMETEGRPR